MNDSDPLTADEIEPHLTTAVLGRRVLAFDRARSTQDVARDLASTSEENPDGTLVLAEFQSHGRGRFGRAWIAPPRANLLASLILHPRARIARPSLLTLAMGLAVRDAIASAVGLRAAIRWPNDVTIRSRKVGGILTESGIRARRSPFWIVGFGVNVNMRTDDFPPELAGTATSLAVEAGRHVSRAPLLALILAEYERWYGALQRGESQELLRAVRRHIGEIGEPIRARVGDLVLSGRAIDLDDDGALLMRTDVGKQYRLTASESTLL